MKKSGGRERGKKAEKQPTNQNKQQQTNNTTYKHNEKDLYDLHCLE